jgi:hypothetical protein
VALEPSGKFAYVVFDSGSLSVSSVDSATGALSGGSATASDLAPASYTSSIVILQ